MADGALILVAAAVGLAVNILAILGVAVAGGRILGRLETSLTTLATEVQSLRTSRHDHGDLLQRVVAQLDDLERRVGRIEGHHI